MRPASLPAPERYPHGTRARYVAGCRCEPCAEENRAYARLRGKLCRGGEGNGLVPVVAVLAHLRKLSKAGVGRRRIAVLARVPPSTIGKIRKGARVSIRRATEARILAVGPEGAQGAALVPAGPTWKKIRRLLAEGFTKTDLAARLGSKGKTPALQLKGDRILARNAHAVSRLYRSIMVGG